MFLPTLNWKSYFTCLLYYFWSDFQLLDYCPTIIRHLTNRTSWLIIALIIVLLYPRFCCLSLCYPSSECPRTLFRDNILEIYSKWIGSQFEVTTKWDRCETDITSKWDRKNLWKNERLMPQYGLCRFKKFERNEGDAHDFGLVFQYVSNMFAITSQCFCCLLPKIRLKFWRFYCLENTIRQSCARSRKRWHCQSNFLHVWFPLGYFFE